jgi:hypothetical protein
MPNSLRVLQRNLSAVTGVRQERGDTTMTNPKDHPEQDPAEGSRDTIERDLQRQDEKARDGKTAPSEGLPETGQAGAEAAEPSPGS